MKLSWNFINSSETIDTPSYYQIFKALLLREAFPLVQGQNIYGLNTPVRTHLRHNEGKAASYYLI